MECRSSPALRGWRSAQWPSACRPCPAPPSASPGGRRRASYCPLSRSPERRPRATATAASPSQ
eukprot:4521043-Alexandrium_andersonii.AAC.1